MQARLTPMRVFRTDHIWSTERSEQSLPRDGAASHTVHHVRMSAHLGFEVIRAEIHESKAQLGELLGREVSAFCWVEGDQDNYNQAAMLEIKRAGYKIGFMTCSGVIRRGVNQRQSHRTNIEAENPIGLVKLQLSGVMDLYHL